MRQVGSSTVPFESDLRKHRVYAPNMAQMENCAKLLLMFLCCGLASCRPINGNGPDSVNFFTGFTPEEERLFSEYIRSDSLLAIQDTSALRCYELFVSNSAYNFSISGGDNYFCHRSGFLYSYAVKKNWKDLGLYLELCSRFNSVGGESIDSLKYTLYHRKAVQQGQLNIIPYYLYRAQHNYLRTNTHCAPLARGINIDSLIKANPDSLYGDSYIYILARCLREGFVCATDSLNSDVLITPDTILLYNIVKRNLEKITALGVLMDFVDENLVRGDTALAYKAYQRARTVRVILGDTCQLTTQSGESPFHKGLYHLRLSGEVALDSLFQLPPVCFCRE